jgi:mannose-6-phosphate isomerase-like protein (cupin superfamily)
MSQTISLTNLTPTAAVQGAIWSYGGAQMDVNLLYFIEGEGVDTHINHALDVWLVVIQGTGEAMVDGTLIPLEVGTCLYIIAGATRSIVAGSAGLLYASAHNKRGGLMPT